MTLYKVLFEGSHGDFSPEDKAEALADMRENCFLYEPRHLIRDAEMFGILSDLLDFSSAKDLDKQKIDYISSYYSLVTQIENFIREDDKDKFAAFLNANHELIHDFPTNEVFHLLCLNNAPACVTALLESPLRVDIDVNRFEIGVAEIPLEVAAFKLSLPLTQTLLAHGADANAQHGFHTTILDCALATLRSHKRVREWTVKHSTTDLILTLCDSDMTQMAILLFVARKKLLIPYDEWTFKNTPVAKYISQELKQIEFEHDEIAKIKKKTNLNDAFTVAKSVWEACNSCLSQHKFKDVASDFVDSWRMALSKNIFKRHWKRRFMGQEFAMGS